MEGGTTYRKALGDVLDLSTFMTRTTVYFDQLRRAELPATGMLVMPQWTGELGRGPNQDSLEYDLGLNPVAVAWHRCGLRLPRQHGLRLPARLFARSGR